MRKINVGIGLCILMLIVVFGTAFYSLSRRNPSVYIDISGPEDMYYVTLLSESITNYTIHEYKGPEDRVRVTSGVIPDIVWERFDEYAQKDDFYFPAFVDKWDINHSRFSCGDMAPRVFKILIYSPKEDKVIAGERVFRNYLSDTYYEAEVKGEKVKMSMKWSNVILELLMFLGRFGIAFSVKVLLTYFVFRFRQQWQTQGIIRISLMTQMLLQLTVSIIYLFYGLFAFYLFLILTNIIVLLIEGGCYIHLLWKKETTRKEKILFAIYVLLSNGVVFYASKSFQLRLLFPL